MSIGHYSNLVVDRQWRLAVCADLSATTAPDSVIKLPPDTFLLGGWYYILKAATGTSPTVTMTDSSATPVNLLTDIALSSPGLTGNIAMHGTPRYYSTAQALTFTVDGADAAGGRFIIHLDYIVIGRGNEYYGSDGP